MKIAQHMTKAPATCNPTTTLDVAAGLMERHDCGSLPVVPAEGRHEVVGMITDRDVCLTAGRRDKPLRDLDVRDAMSPEVVTCMPDEELETVGRRMKEARVRRIPVVDEGGQLLGLITLSRLARAAAEIHDEKLETHVVGEILAEISRPTDEDRNVDGG